MSPHPVGRGRGPDFLLGTVDAFGDAASGMVLTDTAGIFHRVNAAFGAIVGRDPAELVGQPFASLTSPDDMAVSRAALRDLVEKRVPCARFEKRYVRPDNTLVWVDMSIRALVEDDGAVCGFLAQAVDITARKEAETELRRQALVFRTISDAVFVTDVDGHVLDCNPAAERLSGSTHDDIVRQVDGSCGDLPRGAQWSDEVVAALEEHDRWIGDVTFPIGPQPPRVAAAVVVPVRDEGGLTGAVALCRDVTESRVSARELAQAEERFRLAFDNVPVGMLIRALTGNDRGRLLRANPALCRMLGYTAEELLSLGVTEVTHPDDREDDAAVSEHLVSGDASGAEFEKRFVHRDGHTIWVSVHAAVVRDADGTPQYTVTQVEDITERRAAVEELTERALHDPLTGLANRRLLLDRLEHALARTRRQKHGKLAVLFLDLDRFKPVNDRYGHVVGDRLLVEVAGRLNESVRPGDTVARVGGDEFVVVCEDLSGPKSAERMADRISAAIDPPFRIPRHGGTTVEITIGGSVGVVVTAGFDPPGDLLRRADEAMYAVKALRPPALRAR